MKLDRLLGILTHLLQNNRVTAPKLAEKFEVSRRTIGRDIDTLCAAGIPIITYQGVGGGISIAEGFKLDKSILTKSELSDIIAALKGIGSVSSPSQIESTLDKLGANTESVISMREPIVIDLASFYKCQLTPKIQLIKEAILQSNVIDFDYYYEKGQAKRIIEPYYVIFQWASWYVYGFCLDRNDWRMFKLTRIWNLNANERTFIPRELPPEENDYNNHFIENIHLVAVFDPSVRHILIDSYGLGCYRETSQGLEFEFSFTNRNYMVSWLMGFGAKVKIIKPEYIAQEIKTEAQKILDIYE
ncbi:MAG: YafY family transcriptional regulator [Defluviitaleaceae bacterium]|nr:YafY family transcriptional regulator [Defluviitaleaceae bacterium]